MAVHRAERSNTLMQSSTVDPDIMSDAEDEDEDDALEEEEEEEEEQCADDLFNDEGVRKKLELLAQMVGVDSSESEAGVLLAAVVRVFKDLKESLFFSLECTETDHSCDHFF
ncbi:unnamed protein product [Prunus armeniaca]|uniref:Uncharacterized protein n=1 Tax=Prunus armeniaca TaxID=36596 RepID=A0A6J5XY18_PRUAR|nr:unnamed protein product [Prunus armeniaca]